MTLLLPLQLLLGTASLADSLMFASRAVMVGCFEASERPNQSRKDGHHFH